MKKAICLTYFSSPVTVFSHVFRFVMFSLRQHLSLASYILQPWPIPSSLRPSLSSDNKICPTRFVNFTLYTLIHPFLQRFLVPSIFLYEIFFFLSLSLFYRSAFSAGQVFQDFSPSTWEIEARGVLLTVQGHSSLTWWIPSHPRLQKEALPPHPHHTPTTPPHQNEEGDSKEADKQSHSIKVSTVIF